MNHNRHASVMSTLKFRITNPHPSNPLKGKSARRIALFGVRGQVGMRQIIIDFTLGHIVLFLLCSTPEKSGQVLPNVVIPKSNGQNLGTQNSFRFTININSLS